MLGKILSKAKYHKIYDQFKILALILIALFIYGIIGFSLVKQVDLQTGFILTIESLEFVHHPEPSFLPRALQASIVILGSVFLWFALWTVFDLIFKGHLRKYLIEVINLVKASRASNHTIICGGGRVGSKLAELLAEKGEKVVLIEKDAFVSSKLRKRKFIVINGDALNEETLKEANVEKAKTLVAAISSGERNVLLTLTVKQMNPKIEVLARSDDEAHVKKLKSVGAKQVIMPEIAGAKELFSLLK